MNTKKSKSILSHWNQLINTSCKVIKIGERFVYPVFRNGSSSLEKASAGVFINNDIRICEDIHVLIRDPRDRFKSGVNEYCASNNLDFRETIAKIENGQVIDRHFSPQWIWLFHLKKYYSGNVILRSWDNIPDYTKFHVNKSTHKYSVEAPIEFVNGDLHLSKYFDQKIKLDNLIKKELYALPTS